MIQRGGQVLLHMLPNVQQTTIKPIIEAAVAEGTQIYTDEYDIYARLEEWGYRHKTVHHGAGEYARDEDGFHEIHVNTMEGFWSLLRSPASAGASLAAPASGHFAGEAAALPRLLPVRSQYTQTREAAARRARRDVGRMMAGQHPETPDEPSPFMRGS